MLDRAYFALRSIIALAVIFSLVSCKPRSNENNTSNVSPEGVSATETANTPSEPIKELGLLKSAEDAGYPMMALTIAFPERQFEEAFLLDLERTAKVDAETVSGWVGKYVSFEYRSELSNALLDLKRDGASLLGEYGLSTIKPEIKNIKGIMSNAEHETLGDLPDELYVTTEEEIRYIFPFFITQEIVQANGSQVHAYYEVITVNTILSIESVR